MDLRGIGGSFRFSMGGWRQVLTLAYECGWQPEGTLPPTWDPDYDGSGWKGWYFSNSRQHVTGEDAKAIAKALRDALDDIPDHDVMGDRIEVWSDGSSGIKADAVFTPLEYFSGKGKKYVREFITYCEKGTFLIG